MTSVAETTQLADSVKEWKGVLDAATKENMEIAGTVEFKDGVVHVDSARQETFTKNRAKIAEIKALIDGAEEAIGVKTWLDKPANDPAALQAIVDQFTKDNTPRTAKTVGQLFVESDEFKRLGGGNSALTMDKAFELKAYDLAGRGLHGRKDIYTALPTGSPDVFGPIQRDPLVPLPPRRGRMRDLFNVQQTNSPIIEFFRQTGFVNAASPVAEYTSGAFGLKPHSELTFEGVTTTVKTIAHWEAASRNVLADEPQLRGLIDVELLYGLQLAEDYQILNGTGTGDDLPGILNDDDLQTYSWSAGHNATATGTVGDNRLDAVRHAITLVALAQYETTGIVMHPDDWENCELTKDKNGQYLLALSIAQGGEQRMWRVPVVDSQAITPGHALVGAFGLGAQLYDREQATIRVAEQHADFFVRNGVVVLAEERLALAVKRPEAFCYVSFDHAPN